MAEFDYEWRLRILLAERRIWSHSELIPLLAERGVRLSNTQVWRLVRQTRAAEPVHPDGPLRRARLHPERPDPAG
jgi:hypothetical protein